MYRLVLALVLAFAGPAPAADLVISHSAYGAKPGIGNAVATRKALERCVEVAARAGTVRPIVVPSDPAGYWVDRPVVLAPAAGGDARFFVRGDSPDAVLAAAGAFPPLALGLRQSPTDRATGKVDTWDGSLCPDAFGVLDATAAPRKGVRWGLRTANRTIYSFTASPLSHGPNGAGWPAVRTLTVDLAYRAHATSQVNVSHNGAQVCGLATAGVPKPWYVGLDADGTHHRVAFATAEADKVTTHYFWVGIEPGGMGEGLRRLSFSIDLDKGTVVAWAGGKQAAVDWRWGGEPGPGLTFADNDVTPFKLGGLGDGVDAWQDNYGGPVDYTFHGIRLTNGHSRWVVGEIGSPQRFRDDFLADDAGRYFAGWGDAIAVLPLGEFAGLPTERQASRWVPVYSAQPGSLSYGFAWLAAHHTYPYNCGSQVRLADLELRGGGSSDRFGSALWVGGSIGGGMRFERCTLTGGYYGAEGVIGCVNYPIVWRDCTFQGLAGDGYFGAGQSVRFAGVTTVRYPARNGVRLRMGGASFDYLFISETGPRCETFLRMEHGGQLVVRNFMLDTEYTPSPTVAGVLAERGHALPGSRLVLEDGTVAGVAPDAPLVWLKDVAPPTDADFKPSTVRIRGITAWGERPGPTVRTDGPGWSGAVQDWMGGPVKIENVSTYGPGEVRVEE